MGKAVSLFSGSLASIVATSLVNCEESVEGVDLITFRSPFFENYELIKETAQQLWPNLSFRSQSVKKKCEELSNIPSEGSFNITASCKGCRTLLLRRGKRFMDRVGGDFLVTGEILGRNGIGEEVISLIDKEAGVEGLVYRPLSADLLASSRAEEEGWVSRTFDITAGQEERLRQLASGLVDKDISNYDANQRCKLTDHRYGKRLEDLLSEPNFTTNVLRLLEFDKYYKVPPDTKIVLGMTEEEKRELQNYFLPRDLRVYLPSHQGPMTLVRTDWEEKEEDQVQQLVDLASRITVYHSDGNGNGPIPVNYRFENDSETYRLDCTPIAEDKLEQFLIDSENQT